MCVPLKTNNLILLMKLEKACLVCTTLSASGDELDIVGEATIDDSASENHLGGPLPSVPFCPIVECTGLSRASWVNLKV